MATIYISSQQKHLFVFNSPLLRKTAVLAAATIVVRLAFACFFFGILVGGIQSLVCICSRKLKNHSWWAFLYSSCNPEGLFVYLRVFLQDNIIVIIIGVSYARKDF